MTVGVGAVAHYALGAPGRILTAVAMHEKRQKEKKAAAGLLPDQIALNVTVQLSSDRFRSIQGTQNDKVTLAGKTVTIVSTWSFTKAGKP